VTGGSPAALAAHGHEALLLVAAVSLPVLGAAAVVGLVVAAFQAASQIQDPTIAHLPRMLTILAVLLVAGAWMGHQIAAFAQQMFAMAGG
jgi:flagellar biosynthesis protein FliQ